MKTAVVLFNLGGPDSLVAVRPFLFNLFNDQAIIDAPQPMRRLLASMLSTRREKFARANYARLGGLSPLLPNTEAQAASLNGALDNAGLGETRCFVAMRYWHPFIEDAVVAVAAWRPDRIVLLPLYPQYSTTTMGSSMRVWRSAAEKTGLTAPATLACCWPEAEGFVEEMAGLVRRLTYEARAHGVPRVLFSAHGLPKKVIARGDPYQWQVERTAVAVAARLGAGTDWRICYQSRVGPLEWIGPATDDEIRRAGADGVPVVVVPIAFVSEHVETLVELDVEYAKLARHVGVPAWFRAPTVDTRPAFIAALVGTVRQALDSGGAVAGPGGRRLCPPDRTQCPCAREAA
ncbi:MAG: ferrochelatase [Alphaproteobacteria bacterium]|nr:ferrochelatase [Alphaproteobacteria bacterium]